MESSDQHRSDLQSPPSPSPRLDVPLKSSLAQPSISIVHLMIWTAGSALILGVFRQMVVLDQQADYYRRFWRTGQMFMSMIYGASTAALGLFVVRQVRRLWGPVAPLPSQPGHWYLLADAVATTIVWGTYWFVPWRISESSSVWEGESTNFQVRLVTVAIALLVKAGLYVLAAFRCETSRWMALFLGLAGTAGLTALIHLAALSDESQLYSWLPLSRFFTALACLGLLATVYLDLKTPPRRDWLHWVGLATALAHFTLYWSWVVWCERQT